MPHRQFVFTLPQRLRIYFRFERRILGELCRAAWEVVRTVFQSVSGHPEAVPGMIGAIQNRSRRFCGIAGYGRKHQPERRRRPKRRWQSGFEGGQKRGARSGFDKTLRTVEALALSP